MEPLHLTAVFTTKGNEFIVVTVDASHEVSLPVAGNSFPKCLTLIWKAWRAGKGEGRKHDTDRAACSVNVSILLDMFVYTSDSAAILRGRGLGDFTPSL